MASPSRVEYRIIKDRLPTALFNEAFEGTRETLLRDKPEVDIAILKNRTYASFCKALREGVVACTYFDNYPCALFSGYVNEENYLHIKLGLVVKRNGSYSYLFDEDYFIGGEEEAQTFCLERGLKGLISEVDKPSAVYDNKYWISEQPFAKHTLEEEYVGTLTTGKDLVLLKATYV